MRLHRSALLAVLVLWCLACAPSALGAPVTSRWQPLEDDFDSCTGERVYVTGQQHIVEQEVEAGDLPPHLVFHRNVVGTGIGSVSGATYVHLDSYTKIDRTVSVVDGTTVVTEIYETVFIRLGETSPDDDTYVRWVTRTTIAPDGTQTVKLEIESATCR